MKNNSKLKCQKFLLRSKASADAKALADKSAGQAKLKLKAKIY